MKLKFLKLLQVFMDGLYLVCIVFVTLIKRVKFILALPLSTYLGGTIENQRISLDCHESGFKPHEPKVQGSYFSLIWKQNAPSASLKTKANLSSSRGFCDYISPEENPRFTRSETRF